ncbi:hypothetical protein CBR_g20245 [Chara braunii]|uniref:Uncharacterized protein n=1 Tax=Chara braunii TaxID=69332 RepID=A0A388KZY8_CHABU|nr:hypothetical protein CBR_g20245 [Chara braunii]|eukprot:GBG75615.1 hypothetical protein CBR_g20245 [Chara braunii]
MDVISGYFDDTSLRFVADKYISLIKTMSTKQLLEEKERIAAAIDRRTFREDTYNKLSLLTVGVSKIGSSIVGGRISIAKQKLEIIQAEIDRRGLTEHGQTAAEDIHIATVTEHGQTAVEDIHIAPELGQTAAEDICIATEPVQMAAEHVQMPAEHVQTAAERSVLVNNSKSDTKCRTAHTQHMTKGINSVEERGGKEEDYAKLEEKQKEEEQQGGRRAVESVATVIKGTAVLLATSLGDGLCQGVAEGVGNVLLEVGMAVVSGL